MSPGAIRPLISVCIPAYNRVRCLAPLLDSVLAQNFDDFEIVICEDHSPERLAIRHIAQQYIDSHPNRIRYFENETNLGYDANIRQLVDKAAGHYCFFMGNDDLMCPGALRHLAELTERHPDLGFVLRGYAVFDQTPENIVHELRYFAEERALSAAKEAIVVCYRRSGVISGYIVHRDDAHAAATDRFDGTLYYQMHLTASVLWRRNAVCTPRIMVLCRANEPPDFGNSEKEKAVYTPGRYTVPARLNMVRGALSIIADFDASHGQRLTPLILQDYANYFYPFIVDQLTLPLGEYLTLYRGYCSMGFWRYPMFHLYCGLCYLLGARRFDRLTRVVRGMLGRNVRFGMMAR
jgi:glycosyltransferase involved in cell wall biosynthesis